MIHVCFALHDNDGEYSKYTATAICSVLENTFSDVTVHLFCDETLSSENINLFRQLVGRYNKNIVVYTLDSGVFYAQNIKVGSCSIGTLFRLKMADLLPDDVKKVIYLDSDVVVNLDIRALWDIDLGENFIAAKAFAENSYWMCRKQFVPVNEYFNAGVLLLDLEKIRCQMSLWDMAMDFFIRYPNCQFADNDALNYVFKGRTRFLDDRFNSFSSQVTDEEVNKIYHFAGDFVNPLQNNVASKLFFSYFIKTPWGTAEAVEKYYVKAVRHYHRQLTMYQKILAKFASKANVRCILFGASGRLNKNLYELISHKDIDYYVDNNCAGEHTENSIPVLLPDVLKKEKRGSFIVIVSSIAYYNDIKLQLESYGLKEDEDFFDGRWLLTIEQGGYDSQKQ